MRPTIISKHASNWVDRGESPRATIERILGKFLDRNPVAELKWFREQADTITGMVAAGATEVHLVGYLRTLVAYCESTRDANTLCNRRVLFTEPA